MCNVDEGNTNVGLLKRGLLKRGLLLVGLLLVGLLNAVCVTHFLKIQTYLNSLLLPADSIDS